MTDIRLYLVDSVAFLLWVIIWPESEFNCAIVSKLFVTVSVGSWCPSNLETIGVELQLNFVVWQMNRVPKQIRIPGL